MTAVQDILELTEFVSANYGKDELRHETALELRQKHGKQVVVTAPSFFEDYWTLTPQGWIGYIPLSDGTAVSIQPKIRLGNLFRMLEYAYATPLEFMKGTMECQSLQDFYEQLANVLAKRVLARARQGFYRSYIPEDDRLPYVRGRVDMAKALRSPWDAHLRCHYQEHTSDIEDNQILTWTLRGIARTGLCRDEVLSTVRGAYRVLQNCTSLDVFAPHQCVGRFYHRLNCDYEPMHGLCRFFLEHTGPSNSRGDKKMLPFLIDMASLFERFVAAWLKQHLPDSYEIKVQERVHVSEGVPTFQIDLVLYDAAQGRALMVLDTKYKKDMTPSNDDINQVVAYAQLKDCRDAVLIYPTKFIHTVDTPFGQGHRLRSLSFDLSGDLDQAGKALLDGLGIGNALFLAEL
jgi:5-methylcytosine-specific restriction enzyme subunit McrC